VKELMQHTRGILALDWCASDSSMLLSAGKVMLSQEYFWNAFSAG
jgi:hypothetical protein